MTAVEVFKISFQPSTRNYFILLKEIEGNKIIPLKIGSYEAQSIALAMESIEESRPMTHDLICAIFSEVDFNLKSIRITDLRNGVFFSKLDIESKKFGKYHIDARPSDAIAIAIRINAPILVSNKIIDNLSPQLITTFEPSHESDDRKALKTLKLKLENAVKNERYEVAANLRDKIKKIEG